MINGKRLKALRKREKMSAEELAEYLGVGRQQIVRYEAEQTEVTSDKVLKIAQFFDVTTDYLLGNSDQEKGYDRGHRATIDIDRLVNISPTNAARFVKALNISIEPSVLTIDVDHLLENFPPNYVALFLKELGHPIEVKPSKDKPSESPK
jgi:transcriptional regulator with XRE-family HTH domain